MVVRLGQGAGCKSGTACVAFTLIEILMCFFILTLVMAGIIYGYVQANRMAEWCSMSLAGQSYASQGAEQARAHNWEPYSYPPTNGPGTLNELVVPTSWTNYGSNYILDIPISGDPTSSNFAFFVTNYVSVSNVYANLNPQLEQIWSKAVWIFPETGQAYTNTVVLLRAPDQ